MLRYGASWRQAQGWHFGIIARIEPRTPKREFSRLADTPMNCDLWCLRDHNDPALGDRAVDHARLVVRRLRRRLCASGRRMDLLRSVAMVGTAGGSELVLRWTLVRVETSRPVPAALARQGGF